MDLPDLPPSVWLPTIVFLATVVPGGIVRHFLVARTDSAKEHREALKDVLGRYDTLADRYEALNKRVADKAFGAQRK